MDQAQTYVVTLTNSLRFVAEMEPEAAALPGTVSLRLVFLHRTLHLPLTSILCFAPCAASEVKMNAKSLNGYRKVQQLFGEHPISVRVK